MQERVPGLERDGAALDGGELAAVHELARRTAADDPAFADRLRGFGGYSSSPLGLPSRWAVLPVALLAVLLALGVLASVAVPAANGSTAEGQAPATVRHLPK